jgi:hypothetical protein
MCRHLSLLTVGGGRVWGKGREGEGRGKRPNHRTAWSSIIHNYSLETGVPNVNDVYPYQGPDQEQLDEKAGGQNPHGDTPTKYCRQVRLIEIGRQRERNSALDAQNQIHRSLTGGIK